MPLSRHQLLVCNLGAETCTLIVVEVFIGIELQQLRQGLHRLQRMNAARSQVARLFAASGRIL
jgi:hypothetical protein